MQFFESARAGNGVFTTNGGSISSALGGDIIFNNTSTADHGIFITDAGVPYTGNGIIIFYDNTTAANGTFTNNGGDAEVGRGGGIRFLGSASAGAGTFTNGGGSTTNAVGGSTVFSETSTAGNATLIANSGSNGGYGGTIELSYYSTGGTARVKVFGNGSLDVSSHFSQMVAIGSLEGTGVVILGPNNLAIGANNLSAAFSGVIEDSQFGDMEGGAITKTGHGTMVLSGNNTYTGTTTVLDGDFFVSGTIVSPVTVNWGILRRLRECGYGYHWARRDPRDWQG